MKKRSTTTLLLAAACLAALAGCGGGGGNPGACMGSAAQCIANDNPNVSGSTDGGIGAGATTDPVTPTPGTEGLPVAGVPTTGATAGTPASNR